MATDVAATDVVDEVAEAAEDNGTETKKRRRKSKGPRGVYRLGESRQLVEFSVPDSRLGSEDWQAWSPTKHRDLKLEHFVDTLDYWKWLVHARQAEIEIAAEQVDRIGKYDDPEFRKGFSSVMSKGTGFATELCDLMESTDDPEIADQAEAELLEMMQAVMERRRKRQAQSAAS